MRKIKKVKEGVYLKELFVKNVVNETTDFLDNNQRIKLKEILTQEELLENSRSKSAKLRIFEKI